MDTLLYCVEYESQYGNSYHYMICKDIKELAKRVNGEIENSLSRIKGVYLVDNYDSKLECKVFMDIEYDMQYFIEGYEDRLIMHYGLQHAV